MDNLPDEILVNILKYLNTFELLQFCEAYGRFEYLLRERKLIRRVILPKIYQLHQRNVNELIVTKLDPALIYTLNINSLYWIPIADLLKLLNKLENLKELYALDTKLGLSKKIPAYKKLTKLALTITDIEVQAKELYNLKSLFVKIVLDFGSFNFQNLFNDKWCLDELWISNEQRVVDIQRVPYILNTLKKLVIRSTSLCTYYDFRMFGLYLIFRCFRCGSESEYVYEKVPNIDRAVSSMFEPIENELEKCWEVLHRNHNDISCGPRESKRLYLKENITDIYFEDLNFGHSIVLCQIKYIRAALKILRSKNCCSLKRLQIRSCLFQRQRKEDPDDTTENNFSSCRHKKVRYEIDEEITFDSFNDVAKHLKHLRELEILFCSGCFNVDMLSSYHSISSFENLEKLTLEVPLFLDGSFLTEVLSKCEKLWSLNLTVTPQNEKCMSRLCEGLKYSKSLRDFRLNHIQIHIEKLLSSFCQIPNKKLERIFLKCDHLRFTNSDVEPFKVFLTCNPQLVFFFMIVQKSSVKQNSIIQRIFNEHKKKIAAKIFYVKKDYSFSGYFPIPTAHRDIIYKNTNVAVINFDEF